MGKKSNQNKDGDAGPSEKKLLTRLLARCENCKNEYVPRGRGGNEIADLQLFYIPQQNLDPDKKALICLAHKDVFPEAGLIVSEDCLEKGFASAMGMVGLRLSEKERQVAKANRIWPKDVRKIEIDLSSLSSLSDAELLKVVRGEMKKKRNNE